MRIIPSEIDIYRNNKSLIALVIADLIPLFGVFYYGWDAFIILLLYWSENLIIGFYNILRMIFLQTNHIGKKLSKIFMIPFFTLHYGAFCAGHGFFLFAIFGKDPFKMANESGVGFIPFLDVFVGVVQNLIVTMPKEFFISFFALFLSHGISFLDNYIGKEEYKHTNLKTLMTLPYNRIIVMHITIIAGGFLLVVLDSPAYMLLILVLIKIVINIKLHIKEHKKLQAFKD